MKHTPGPWKSKFIKNSEWAITGDNGYCITTIPHDDDHGDTPADHANARLIAAAPDLLDIIQFALDEFRSKECDCDGSPDFPYACYFHRIENDLRLAVAKATGESK